MVSPPFGGGNGGVNIEGRFVVGGVVRSEEEEFGRAVILILDLCEEVVQNPGMCVSKQ